MACRLLSAMPLPKLMLTHSQIGSAEQISVKYMYNADYNI